MYLILLLNFVLLCQVQEKINELGNADETIRSWEVFGSKKSKHDKKKKR